MLLAVSRTEISKFLEIDANSVDAIWSSGKLKKSLFPYERNDKELAASSIFDVIEYFLAEDGFGNKISHTLSAEWVDLLARVSDIAPWSGMPFEEKCVHLYREADFEGLALDGSQTVEKLVCTLVALQDGLMDLIQETENLDELMLYH